MRRYRDSYRRLLVDMHIPDWDDRFLSRYEPAGVVDRAVDCGATGLMLYFQAHTGLCYWPTRSGQQHRAFQGRDPVAESLAAAKLHDVPVCAYYSINFNNWAWQQFPEWRLHPASRTMIGGGLLQTPRYGICCMNSRDYRHFAAEQIREIVSGYDVDALFCDMVWWMSLCLCANCRTRYREETGLEIPLVVDWLSPDWCQFQAARERWVTELAASLRAEAKRLRPDMDVYHNFALAMTNWTRGVHFSSAKGHDFLGGDFYGGPDEQLVISRLMLNLSENRPVEFMTTVTANLAEHEQLKPAHQLQTQNLAATACCSAYLMIAAVDPDGGINDEMLDRCRLSFEQARKYEPFLGGDPVEDVAVYFSDSSKMSFADNGSVIADAPSGSPMKYPHYVAVKGACTKLQRAQVAFGVITRKQLSDLGKYRVVLLPNLLRMDAEEIAAFRQYVQRGGRLYASAFTSTTDSSGARHANFALADVFGCRFEQVEQGLMIHLRPAPGLDTAAIAKQRYLTQWIGSEAQPAAVRLAKKPAAEILMTLTLPYGYPAKGSIGAADWSSIHSSPPWSQTDHPVVVRNRFGAGEVIYSAASIEEGTSEAHELLLQYLVRSLLRDSWRVRATATPRVWMSVFEQPGNSRWLITFLDCSDEPVRTNTGPIEFELRPPPGSSWSRLETVPAASAVPYTLGEGVLRCRMEPNERLTMITAYYTTESTDYGECPA